MRNFPIHFFSEKIAVPGGNDVGLGDGTIPDQEYLAWRAANATKSKDGMPGRQISQISFATSDTQGGDFSREPSKAHGFGEDDHIKRQNSFAVQKLASIQDMDTKIADNNNAQAESTGKSTAEVTSVGHRFLCGIRFFCATHSNSLFFVAEVLVTTHPIWL